jgi:peptidoglycan lytic transglycosylase
VTRILSFALVLLLIQSGIARADAEGGSSLGAIGAFFHRLLHGAPPAPPARVHYVIGAPYQVNGIWYYPREQFGYDATGIAAVYDSAHPRLTADGEPFDPQAMAAAHRTLQLPAVARVTNLENGRQVLLRVNDRGPAPPGRLIAVTPRVAELLGFTAAGTARVRMELDEPRSQALAQALQGGIGLRIAAAPRGAVVATELPPPAGMKAPAAAPQPPVAAATRPSEDLLPQVPQRLPETVTEVTPAPGRLWVECDTFASDLNARHERTKLAGLGAEIVHPRNGAAAGATVRIGPIATIAEADSLLGRALRAGVGGAHIVVEPE